ncbi:MAG: rhodanese [Gammaproteobacteria bacterium]|nr:MAG: rhodanese [Gammaproteobacteria bacterium]
MKTPLERVAEAKAKIVEISIDQFKCKDISNCTIIDVREGHEHEDCKIENSINIPRGVLEFEILKNCKTAGLETEIIVYCKTGGRSALAAESLLDLGFSNILSLQGGFDAWKAG